MHRLSKSKNLMCLEESVSWGKTVLSVFYSVDN